MKLAIAYYVLAVLGAIASLEAFATEHTPKQVAQINADWSAGACWDTDFKAALKDPTDACFVWANRSVYRFNAWTFAEINARRVPNGHKDSFYSPHRVWYASDKYIQLRRPWMTKDKDTASRFRFYEGGIICTQKVVPSDGETPNEGFCVRVEITDGFEDSGHSSLAGTYNNLIYGNGRKGHLLSIIDTRRRKINVTFHNPGHDGAHPVDAYGNKAYFTYTDIGTAKKCTEAILDTAGHPPDDSTGLESHWGRGRPNWIDLGKHTWKDEDGNLVAIPSKCRT